MTDLRELVDHTEIISNDDVVYRRFGWALAPVEPDEVEMNGECPLCANHFGDYSRKMAAAKGYSKPCMSVGLRSVLLDHGFDASKLLEKMPDYGVASIRVGDLRNLLRPTGADCPQGVMLCPEPGEPWHAVVFDRLSPQRSDAAKKSILARASIEIPLIRLE
jgi:hypothetical protein